MSESSEYKFKDSDHYGKGERKNLEAFSKYIIGGGSLDDFLGGISVPKGSKPLSYEELFDTYRSNIEFEFAKMQGIKTGPFNRKLIRDIFNDAYYNYFLKKKAVGEKYNVYEKIENKIMSKLIKDENIITEQE